MLVTVLAVAGVIIFVLLVYSGIVIYQVGDAYARTEACSKEIIRLRRKHPSPVEANKQPIQEDMLNYRESAERFYAYFGRPYEAAVNRFLTVLLNVEDASLLPEKRREFIAAYRARVHSGSNASSDFINFRESYNQDGRWEEATREFVKAMEKTSSDIHFGNDADRVALIALSLPYSLQNSDMMQRYLDNCRERFSESIQVQKDAQDFGLAPRVADTYNDDDYPLIVYHLDTISDMVRRFKKAQIESLGSFTIVGGIPAKDGTLAASFEERGPFSVVRFVFEVNGKLESIRELSRLLGDAASEHRIYVVKSIYLYAHDTDLARAQEQINPQTTQGAQELQNGDAPRRLTRQERRMQEAKKALAAEEERKRQQEAEEEAKLPFQQRRGYGEALFGGNQDCRAIFDVEYVIAKPTE